jgi:hypothetical protein
MTGTTTDIINLASHLIGSGTVSGDNGTEKVSMLGSMYLDAAIEEAITTGEFQRFLKYAELTPKNDPLETNPITGETQLFLPTSQWGYAYTLPNDFILSHSLQYGGVFEIRDGILWTNESPCVMMYYYKPTALSGLNIKYLKYIAACLAELIVNELKGSIQEVAFSDQIKEKLRREAMAYDKRNRFGQQRRAQIWGEFPGENQYQNKLVNKPWDIYGSGSQ